MNRKQEPFDTMIELFNIGELVSGVVVKRPSSICKTPYVADVVLSDGQQVLAHTTSLGCCGLADKTAKVLMKKVENKKNVCQYKIILSVKEEGNNVEYIGIDTGLPERIVQQCLHKNCIHILKKTKRVVSQVTMLNSRFDFGGIDEHDVEFILEVKNAPLADYVDCYAKNRKHIDTSKYEYNDKISYFPDGYRKKIKDTVSPRALKHTRELQEIKNTTGKRAILCYVIQRTDVSSFQPSIIDPIYRQAVIEAHNDGVEIVPVVIKWEPNGTCYFVTSDLKINI